MSNLLRIDTPNGRVALHDSGGRAMPLVLLHGTATGAMVFRKQFEGPLARSFRLIAIDLPGHGDSENAANPETGYTVAGLADAVAAILARLGLSRPLLYGWSLGGHVGYELLARGLLGGLMTSGAPPIRQGLLGALRAFRPRLDMNLATKVRFTEDDARHFLALCMATPPDADMVALARRADGRGRPILVSSLMRGPGYDQRDAVEAASVPVALLNGANDPLIRLRYFDGLRTPRLWKGAAQVIAGAGHAPFWDQTASFDARLHRFATDVAGVVVAPADPLPRTG